MHLLNHLPTLCVLLCFSDRDTTRRPSSPSPFPSRSDDFAASLPPPQQRTGSFTTTINADKNNTLTNARSTNHIAAGIHPSPLQRMPPRTVSAPNLSSSGSGSETRVGGDDGGGGTADGRRGGNMNVSGDSDRGGFGADRSGGYFTPHHFPSAAGDVVVNPMDLLTTRPPARRTKWSSGGIGGGGGGGARQRAGGGGTWPTASTTVRVRAVYLVNNSVRGVYMF